MTEIQSSQTHRAATPSWAPFQCLTECRETAPERRQRQKVLGSLRGPRARSNPRCDDWIQYQRSIPPPSGVWQGRWKRGCSIVQHYQYQNRDLSVVVMVNMSTKKDSQSPCQSAVDCAYYLLTHLPNKHPQTHPWPDKLETLNNTQIYQHWWILINLNP